LVFLFAARSVAHWCVSLWFGSGRHAGTLRSRWRLDARWRQLAFMLFAAALPFTLPLPPVAYLVLPAGCVYPFRRFAAATVSGIVIQLYILLRCKCTVMHQSGLTCIPQIVFFRTGSGAAVGICVPAWHGGTHRYEVGGFAVIRSAGRPFGFITAAGGCAHAPRPPCVVGTGSRLGILRAFMPAKRNRRAPVAAFAASLFAVCIITACAGASKPGRTGTCCVWPGRSLLVRRTACPCAFTWRPRSAGYFGVSILVLST